MQPATPSPTTFLTGLRGLAALIVAFTHFIAGELDTGFRGFFASPAEENRRIYQLFPFRIIFADQAMVALFFIVSAYSIAIGPIKRRPRGRTGDGDSVNMEAFAKSLMGSVVRRPIRLYFPVVVLEVVSHIVFALGLYDANTLYWERVVTGPDTVLHFISYMLEALWPFPRESGRRLSIGLNIQIWTIPAEFRGSLVVFGMVFATAGMKPSTRLGIVGGVAALAAWHVEWVVFTFLAGLGIAEVRAIRDGVGPGKNEHVENAGDEFDELPVYEMRTTWRKHCWTVANWVLFLVGFYLLTIPEQPAADPWSLEYAFLKPFAPSDSAVYPHVSQLFRSIGGVAFVFAISNSKTLQKPFNSALVQYLGKISFGLYLVHILIYKVARDDLIRLFWWWRGKDDATGWTGAALVLWPVVWGAAHLFWKYVDTKAVELSRWVDRKVNKA